MIRFITTFGFSGLLPKAPGTWGSLAALPFVWLMVWFDLTLIHYLAIVLALFLIGWWAVAVYTRDMDDPDLSEIVVDEVIGMWIACGFYFVSWAPILPFLGVDMETWATNPERDLITGQSAVVYLAAFGLFRFFDIKKPWLVGWADRLHTPLGVMLDDLIAGIFTLMSLVLFLSAILFVVHLL
ncbi:MAG: phosphatidylglycerophosphatase A [Pseudomonadota bacterium]